MKEDSVYNYFSENAEAWISDAYEEGYYNYPIGLHRLRIVKEILFNNKEEGRRLTDLGCGGGDLCICAAELEYKAIGVDQSEEMIAIASAKLPTLLPKTADRITFICDNLEDLSEHIPDRSQDLVSALGLLGYLPEDEPLFILADRLLVPGGKLIVSCRNRLFNMFSIGPYTIQEIKSGEALSLIDEIDSLYHEVPPDISERFLRNIKETVLYFMPQNMTDKNLGMDMDKPMKSAPEFKSTIEGRQHTPKKLIDTAKRMGFISDGLYGVHPHLMVPRLNYYLPPQIYNRLCDSLCTFEKLPISLIWSSAFIAVFQKI